MMNFVHCSSENSTYCTQSSSQTSFSIEAMNFNDVHPNMPLDTPLDEMLDTIPPTTNPSNHAQPASGQFYSPIFPPPPAMFSSLGASLDVASAVSLSSRRQSFIPSRAAVGAPLMRPPPTNVRTQPHASVKRKPTIRDWSTVACMQSDAVAVTASPSSVASTPAAERLEHLPTKRAAHPSHVDLAAAADVASAASSGAHVDMEDKKQMRAERNRQSAAASRERKKQYVNNLQQRAQILKQENAALHNKDLPSLQQHNEAEKRLTIENERLRLEAIERDMEMRKLMNKVKQVAGKVEPGAGARKHNTWDTADLQAKLDALVL